MASFLFSSWGLLSLKPAPLVSFFWPQVGLCWAEGNIRADRSQLRSVVLQVCPQTSSISITRETDFTNANPLGVPVHTNVQEPLAQVCLKLLWARERRRQLLLLQASSHGEPLRCALLRAMQSHTGGGPPVLISPCKTWSNPDSLPVGEDENKKAFVPTDKVHTITLSSKDHGYEVRASLLPSLYKKNFLVF